MDSPWRRPPPHHPPPPSSSRPPLDLEVTVVSAKHLKNVNWRGGGQLKPYVVVYLDPDRRAATRPDDGGSTRPVWNERLALPLHLPSPDAPLFLTLDVFHSKPSETPKPLVGTARSPLKDLLDPEAFASGDGSSPTSPIRTLELRRPSGRPQGKIRIKLAVREHPSPPPHPSPSPAYWYSNAPPFPYPPHPPPHSARDYRTFSPPPPPLRPYGHHVPPQPHPHPSQYPYGGYSDPYSSIYYPCPAAGYYSAPPVPAPARPYCDRESSYGSPSASTGYSSGFSPYNHRPKVGRTGAATGFALGAVAGGLAGLALDEGLKYEEKKIADRVKIDFSARDDYSDYGAHY